MASASTLKSLSDAQTKLQTLSQQKVSLSQAVTDAQVNIDNNRQLLKAGNDGWKSCENSHCGFWNSKDKCNGCRDPYHSMILKANRDLPALLTKLQSAKDLLRSKETEIVEHQETIEAILRSIKAENKAEQTLASQGTSSAQLVIDAEAEAQAMVIEAQQKAENEERKSKSKKLIIVTIVLAGVSLAVVYAIYKIKKLRSKKKK